MPFPSRDLLRLALDALNQHYSPLLTLSLPCMLEKRIPTCALISEARDEAIRFGERDETEWLDQYHRVRGGPAGKPYFMPGTREWVQERYPGRALQRRRKDFEGSVFFHPDLPRWALRTGAAEVLREKVLKGKPPVPLVALMVWMWRERDIPSLEEGLSTFIREVGFDRDELIGNVYDGAIPPEFLDAGLAEEPPSGEIIAELIGAQTPPPKLPALADAIAAIEQALTGEHFLAAPGLVNRIIGGWLVGDIVVLVGPAGTGKTFLAKVLSKALRNLFGEDRFFEAFLEIAPHYDIAQFLGYENLGGQFTAGRFAEEVLFLGEPSDPRLVILDEWNLAQIDAYFAPILSVVETRAGSRLPGRLDFSRLTEDKRDELSRAQPGIANGQWMLPEDTFFLATCNSWLDEPETRLPISGPVKRRCRIITMPNVLERQLKEKGRNGLIEISDQILAQERSVIERRRFQGNISVLDEHRRGRLSEIRAFADLEERAREKLLLISRILLENPHTRHSFTVGVYRDILLSCIYARAGEEFAALGEEIADKVLHQVLGDPKILEVLSDIGRDFPNADEIAELVRRMGAFTGERKIRPLV